MARLVKGDVVVVRFPFSDLSQAKRHPALVVASMQDDDVILCQIPSQAVKDPDAIVLVDGDFEHGGLSQPSHIWPNRLFTADSQSIRSVARGQTSGA